MDGFIIDIRDCPGGDDDTAITIINRFCDRRRVAFHRQTKIGPGEDDFTPLKTWHIEPEGDAQFTGPIVLLTCDSVFSGGEAFALAIKQLPHVTIVGDHTNGIFSYELEKRLPNGWRYSLSYQKYFSADMVCYEGKGVPADIELFNSKSDIEVGTDPLITRAIEVLKSGNAEGADEMDCMRWMIIFLLPLCLSDTRPSRPRSSRRINAGLSGYPKARLARVNLDIATTELTRRSIFQVNWT